MYFSSFTVLILAIAGFSATHKADGNLLRHERQENFLPRGTFRILQHQDDSAIQDLEDRVEILMEAVKAKSKHNAEKNDFNDYEEEKKNIGDEVKKMQSQNNEEFGDEENYQLRAKSALTNKIKELKDRVQEMKDEIEVENENRSEDESNEHQTRIDELKNMLTRSKVLSQEDDEELDIEDDEEEESKTENTSKIEDEMNNMLVNEENQLNKELHGKANLLKEILSKKIDKELQDEVDRENELITLKEMLNSIEEKNGEVEEKSIKTDPTKVVNEENQLNKELHGKANLLKEILSKKIDKELQDEIDRENELITLKEMLNSIEEKDGEVEGKSIKTDPTKALKMGSTSQIIIIVIAVALGIPILLALTHCLVRRMCKKQES